MVNAERKNLKPLIVLISNAHLCLKLWEDHQGHFFVSSTSCNPKGIVYYATDEKGLFMFLESKISLQELFAQSPSHFVEIEGETKTALYSIIDSEIELKYGHQTFKQLRGITISNYQV
jgi:hypothetical protein